MLSLFLDSYALPAQPYVPELQNVRSATGGGPPSQVEQARRRAEVVQRNVRGAFPAPQAWQPSLSLSALDLGPGAAATVELNVVVPRDATPGKRQPFNVSAMDAEGRAIGGVTLIVEVL